MTVTGFDVVRRERVAEGKAFADIGPYEELAGIVRIAIDPRHPANATITDLLLAPTARDGLIHCDADLVLARPCDPAARGRLLVDIPNRGRPSATRWLNDAKGFPAPSVSDVGSGFLMRQGFTIARGGWQFDVPVEPGRMRLRGPAAARDGRPITGLTLCQFQLEAPANGLSLSDRDHGPYPAADPYEPGALLTVRPYSSAEPSGISRASWRFARSDDGVSVADAAHVWLEGGFQPGLLYELTYTATGASIVGLGLLAIRDIVTWLLRGTAAQGNLCAGELRYGLAYGESQTGRLLREMLYYGLNQGEDGEQRSRACSSTSPGHAVASSTCDSVNPRRR